MTALRIFFPFYGGKYEKSLRYPVPECSVIIEPFCGAAGYSVRHHNLDIRLNDADPAIAGTWDYLIHAREREIRALPLLGPGEPIPGSLPQEARWLIGWWVNPGSAVPKTTMTKVFGSKPGEFRRTRHWGEAIKDRIASQVCHIRHWTITCKSYQELGNCDATWFIDPPYQQAGRYYRLGPRGLDYQQLAGWARARQGQVIACEDQSADWLPFSPLYSTLKSPGNGSKGQGSAEAVWHRPLTQKAIAARMV